MSSTSPPLTYDLSMRQQPKHSRMCGVGSKADRRPIDPPPIVQLKVYSNLNSVKLRQDLSFNHFQSPYFFVYCSLANEHNDDELHLLSETKTRYTTGNVTSSVYCLRDLVLSEVLVAVFPDVSVRVEGRFRLKFSLFEISNSKTYHRKSLFSNPFTVFSAKRFPGMDQSTELSQCLANQGLKIRIRRDNRRDRRKSSKRYFEEDDDGMGGGVGGSGSVDSAPLSPALSTDTSTSNAALQMHPAQKHPSLLQYNFKRPLAPLPSRIANIPANTVPYSEEGGGARGVERPPPHSVSSFASTPLTRPLFTYPFERSVSGAGRLDTMMGLGVGQGSVPAARPRMHSTPVLYRPGLPQTRSFGSTGTQPTSSVGAQQQQQQDPPAPSISPSLNLPRIQLPPIRDLIQAPTAGNPGNSNTAKPADTPPFNPSNFKPPNQR